MNELGLAIISMFGGGGAAAVAVAIVRRPIDARLADAQRVTAEAAKTTAEAAVAKVAGEHLTAIYKQLQVQTDSMDSLRQVVEQHLRNCQSPPDDVLRTWRPPRQQAV